MFSQIFQTQIEAGARNDTRTNIRRAKEVMSSCLSVAQDEADYESLIRGRKGRH